jgi:hypothetical protein
MGAKLSREHTKSSAELPLPMHISAKVLCVAPDPGSLAGTGKRSAVPGPNPTIRELRAVL